MSATQTRRDSLPWYKERWTWLLMLMPATAIVAGFITLWLAITSFDGLVADDYYKQGLAINQTLAAGDPAIAALIGKELNRQQTHLELIASENFAGLWQLRY